MSIGGVSCEVAACIHLRELTTGTRPLFRRTIDLATFCAELSDAKLTTNGFLQVNNWACTYGVERLRTPRRLTDRLAGFEPC